jgi:hypothetical protein
LLQAGIRNPDIHAAAVMKAAPSLGIAAGIRFTLKTSLNVTHGDSHGTPVEKKVNRGTSEWSNNFQRSQATRGLIKDFLEKQATPARSDNL